LNLNVLFVVATFFRTLYFMRILGFIIIFIGFFPLSGWSAQPGPPVVITTTSIIGDVVKQIAGESVVVHTLMPPGTDPHHFEPSARQLAGLSRASIIFINGLGLESFLDPFLAGSAGRKSTAPLIVDLSAGIHPLSTHDHHHDDHDHNHSDANADPHIWVNPMNVAVWADHISAALSKMLPEHADLFQSRAERYRLQLVELDDWIRQSVQEIPVDQRLLVTDHSMLGYFADRYGFEEVGMILPSFSTTAEPSARELARLNDTIRKRGIRAIFIGMSANPIMAERLARDTGITIARIYSGALGAPGSEADHYLDYMKHNVRVIIHALK